MELFRSSVAFWFVDLVGGVVFAGVGQMMAPEQPTRIEALAYPGGAFVVGILVIYAAAYLRYLILAPYRQRDEARAALQRVAGSEDSPIEARAEVFINGDSGSHLATVALSGPTPLGPGRRIPVEIALSATAEVLVEQVELEIAGRRAPSTWASDWVSHGATTTDRVFFEIPAEVAPGIHEVRLVALADGRWWRSAPFSLEAPSIGASTS